MSPTIAAHSAVHHNRLKEARELAGLSLEQLATASGVSKPTIWKIETKPEYWPRAEVAEKLAQALNVNVGWLFWIEGKGVPPKR